MSRETIVEEQDGAVMLIRLNRPGRKNAFNIQMWDELRDALHDAQESDAVRVVVVTGSERSFSAGQDLAEMANYPELDDAPHGYSPCLDRLIAFDKPLIAAVNGVGVGIGLTFLLHCDLVYMAEDARLKAPFAELGVVPEAASSYLLPVIVGWQRAAEILFGAEWIDADAALEMGLARRVLPADQLLDAALERARSIAEHPLGSLRKTKRLMLACRDEQVRAAKLREDADFLECVGSPENLEALAKFFARKNG